MGALLGAQWPLLGQPTELKLLPRVQNAGHRPLARLGRAAVRSATAEVHSGFAALRSQLPFNCRHRPREPHWDVGAARNIARIEQLWLDLRSRFGSDLGFLCGDFGIVDAMFAPVCLRFRSYEPELSAHSRQYMQQVLALPALREWVAGAEAEPARVGIYEA